MSLFDQFNYEEDFSRGGGGGGGRGARESESNFADSQLLAPSGFITTNVEEDSPLFKQRQIRLIPASGGASITHLVAGSNVLMAALSSNIILRAEMVGGQLGDIEEIELGRKPEDQILKMFMDPSANHLIISIRTKDGIENVYIHSSSRKAPVLLRKMKNIAITAVAWNPQASKLGGDDRSTREILIGSAQGAVYEAEIDKTDKFFKQVYKFESPQVEPVTGLRLEHLTTSKSKSGGRKYFIMITSPRLLYQFIGNATATEAPYLLDIFASQQIICNHELPGDLDHSVLSLFARYPSPSESFAWLTYPGIYHGKLDFANESIRVADDGQRIQTVMTEARLLPYSADGSGRGEQMVPVALAITEFHLLLLYRDSFVAVCILNSKVVLEEKFLRTGSMIGLVKDPVMETVYAFSNRAVVKLEAVNETRDIWRLYLEQGKFSDALKYCRGNVVQEDKVLTAQAEKLFAERRYRESAAAFAKTHQSFEEIALRFIDVDESEALRQFLIDKLNSYGSKDKTQLTMLCTWLVEIFLNALNTLKDEDQKEAYDRVQRDFRDFLSKDIVQANLDKPTAYDLIASHGNVDDLIFFANLTQDHERVVLHHIQMEEYEKALEVLRSQERLDLYYRFAPLLMQRAPRETINACMQRTRLEPRQLIPAFIRFQQKVGDRNETIQQVIRYLEWCVGPKMQNEDSAIHNYLVSLYAKLPDDGPLLRFLESQGEDPKYDLKYALRLCTQEGKLRACVAIYSSMKLYEEAVDLALRVDLALARQNANMPTYDTDLRKKLWLRIARHVVKEEQNIKKAMAVLQECELLKIEDILPFFPDFVTIDHFQQDICKSLEEYNRDIESLKEKMDHATESARNIRQDIHDLRNKYGVIAGDEVCGICNYPLLTRTFYLFPCRHGFHSDCLTNEVMAKLKPARQRRVESLLAEIKRQSYDSPAAAADAKMQLDEIIAEDCLMCGEMMIQSVDEWFISKDKLDGFIQSWSLGVKAPVDLESFA